MSEASESTPVAIKVLAVVLFVLGVFAFVGSVTMWGEGFILSFPEGVDYAFPVTDILVNTTLSIAAAVGLWRLKRYGYVAGLMVAGFYLYASVYIVTEAVQDSPMPTGEFMALVVPMVLATLTAIALVVTLWREEARFRR
jgi:uncharacterized membrane protein (DUF2068 family)